MFKPIENIDLNQISLTATRAIVIIGLLMIKPRTLGEIRQALINYKIFDETKSDDILRIDINTIKAFGCEISRATKKNQYRYNLINHPFSLNLQEDEIKILKRVYKAVKETSDIEMLMDFDILFKKLSVYIKPELREEFLGISVFKYYDIDLIKDLLVDCKKNRTIEILYYNPVNNTKYKKQIIAEKIVYRNDKLYLYAQDLNNGKSLMLLIKRIIEVLARKIHKDSINLQTFKVKFLLKDYEDEDISDVETILENKDGIALIEGNYHNDFIAMQRILYFGPKCTVLEPLEFRQKIIQKLKEMRNVYD